MTDWAIADKQRDEIVNAAVAFATATGCSSEFVGARQVRLVEAVDVYLINVGVKLGPAPPP